MICFTKFEKEEIELANAAIFSCLFHYTNTKLFTYFKKSKDIKKGKDVVNRIWGDYLAITAVFSLLEFALHFLKFSEKFC